MRKGGTEVSRLVITVLMKGLGSGASTETGAILTVNIPRADLLTIDHRRVMTDILIVAAQNPEMTKTDQVIPMVTAITIHTAVINLVFANYGL